jgi:hypothetical protein
LDSSKSSCFLAESSTEDGLLSFGGFEPATFFFGDPLRLRCGNSSRGCQSSSEEEDGKVSRFGLPGAGFGGFSTFDEAL